jgi:hypothetical protein
LWTEAWTDGFEQGRHYADLGEQAPSFLVILAPPKRPTRIGRAWDWIRGERVAVYPRWVLVVVVALVAGAAIRTAEAIIRSLG